jgi:hypothetical protein
LELEQLKQRFWRAEARPERFPALTDGDVARAEAALGVRLPHEYLELLAVQNGGSVSSDFDAFPTNVPTSWADDHVCFHTMAGIGPVGAWDSVTESPALVETWEMPRELVLLSGDGHYWVALDYRGLAEPSDPSVVWFDNEVSQDITLATDFRTFIEGLVPGEEFDLEADASQSPTLHVLRDSTGETYCGSPLDGVTWVARELFQADVPHACPDCVRLTREWDAAEGTRS